MINFIRRFFSSSSGSFAKKRLAYALACDRSGMANGMAKEITERIYGILNEYFDTGENFSLVALTNAQRESCIQIQIPVKIVKSN